MPGTMFIQPSSLASLPDSGGAWDRLVEEGAKAVPAGNLAASDQTQPLQVFGHALRYAYNGSGAGKQFVIDHIAAAMGTEDASQDMYAYRSLGAYVAAADLVDMPASTVGANGQTFGAWLAAWPNYQVNGANPNYNTLYKAAKGHPGYWGTFARATLLSIALWLIKEGISPTGSGSPSTATALRDDVVQYIKRYLGDTSVPNTLNVLGSYKSEWAINTFPTTQGVINPAAADVTRSGANIADASLSGPPPLIDGAGKRQQYEALDALDFTLILLINAGYADAASWGNSAVRRNYQFLMDNGLTTTDTYYNQYYWHQPWFANHLWGLNMTVPAVTGAQKRLLTTHIDWLTSFGSTWLTTSGSNGGGTPAPVITAPTVSFTLTKDGQVVSLDAATTAAGSSNIARHIITWGDGQTQTLTEPARTAQHTYAGGQTYTVAVKAEAVDGGSATSSQAVTVVAPSGAPVPVFTVSKTLVNPGEPVTYSFVGTVAPEGAEVTYIVDWGDGSVDENAPVTGSHVYEDVTDTTSFTIQGFASTP